MQKFFLTVAVLGVLAVLSTTAAILDEEVQIAAALGAEPMIAAPADLLCQAATLEPEPLFPSFLDGLRQGSCSCLDQCRFDFQCGPGGSCVPVGPCGCKECAATS